MRKGKLWVVLSVVFSMLVVSISGRVVHASHDIFPEQLDNPQIDFLTHWGPDEPLLVKRSSDFEALTGGYFELDQTPWEDLGTKLGARVMAGDSPDLFLGRPEDFPNLVNQELFQPLDDLIDFDHPIWEGVREINNRLTWKGKRYIAITEAKPWRVVWYNKELFEANGLDTPRDYYYRGEWDWDTLLYLADMLTYDSNGDGNIDQFGFGVDNPLMFVYSTGEGFVNLTPEGIENNLRSPAIARAMNFYQELSKFMEPGLSTFRDTFPQGKVAMCYDGFWVGNELMKTGEFSFVPAPKDPNASEYIHFGEMNNFMIPVGAENVEGAVAAINFFRMEQLDEEMQEEFQRQYREEYGWTDEDFAINDEMAERKQGVMLYSGIGYMGDYVWELGYRMRTEDIPWETLVEEYYPLIQAEIDSFLND